MSQDEIVFDEVQYREPVRLRRPDRDRDWACLAYEVPGPDDLPVFLDRATADAIERHALRDTSVELGGILLGKECVDDQTGSPFVWVTKSLEAKHFENTQASFTYTHASWEEITRERDRLHPDLDIVGWYHTHPDFGVFLSGHDLFIHRHFFGQPLQLAYVVDPIRQTRGFFRWKGGVMEQTGGFFLTAGRAERAALTRLVNDLENIPDADPTAGGGLSPRLEAELIAMLTRPSAPHSGATAADRAQIAMLFGLLGATFGVLGLAAVLWLNTLSGNVQDQARVIKELRDTVAETSDRQRVAFDAALGDSGAVSNEQFLARYTRATRQLDEAKAQLANQALTANLLAAKVKQVNEDYGQLRNKYDEASKFEKEAKEAAELRNDLADLRATNEKQARRLTDLEDVLDTVEGRAAAARARTLQKVWISAIGGWVVSGFLAFALVALYAMRQLSPERPPLPTTEEPPPHTIV